MLLKTLMLVGAGYGLPNRNRLRQLEKQDLHPRVSIVPEVLNSDIIDEEYFYRVPNARRIIYRFIPLYLAQITEAYIKRKDYDVIITWSEQLGIAFAALLKLLCARVPHVTLMYSISKSKKAVPLKLVHSHIDRLVFWTSSQYKFAVDKLRIPSSRILFLNGTVDQLFYRPMGKSTDIICSAGREMRDYATLIKALRGTAIQCHIAPVFVHQKKDSWPKAIEKEKPFPDNISIEQLKDLVELRELYSKSRFVVLPLLQNKTDSGTTVILEAMAMGKAVICSKTDGQRDHVVDGKSGIYVPVGDHIALREAIQYLWQNRTIAEAMGKEGRKMIEERYTLDAYLGKIKDLMLEVIEEHKQQN